MFGYVNVYKNELKIKDYNRFRAYYCGLCKAIATRSSAARLALSYDMTFLAIVLSAVDDNEPVFEAKRCAVHPFHKRAVTLEDRNIAYAADMSVVLDYLKLDDDVKDDKSVKAFIGKAFLSGGMNKLKRKYPNTCEEIINRLEALSKLEREKCPYIDETADCFAKILEALFTPDFIKNDKQRRVLEWLGYNIGRWIYIIDAFADYKKDEKNKSYNTFICGGKEFEEIKKTVDETLTLTLANAASAYELLDIKRNDEILRNIIYMSLKAKQENIIYPEKCGKEKVHESL